MSKEEMIKLKDQLTILAGEMAEADNKDFTVILAASNIIYWLIDKE